MNKKGQVLVAFLLLLPLLFLLIAYIIDLGMYNEAKRNIDSNIKEVITYGLKKETTSDKLQALLKENIEADDIIVHISEGQIKIKVTTKIKTIFPQFWNHLKNDYTITYRGYKNNGIIKIEKE